jgi:hypothetical protein
MEGYRKAGSSYLLYNLDNSYKTLLGKLSLPIRYAGPKLKHGKMALTPDCRQRIFTSDL